MEARVEIAPRNSHGATSRGAVCAEARIEMQLHEIDTLQGLGAFCAEARIEIGILACTG